MKVLIVSNNYYLRGNGVCTAVQALRSRLLEKGIDVRILACENSEAGGAQPDYPLKHFKFPVFEPIIKANGYRYPKVDKTVIRKAVEWADVIHLMEGFPLQSTAARIASRLGKPCVGTYHIFTDNITANLEIGYDTFVNRLINKWWSSSVYNHCTSVQCPTTKVKEHLEKNGYTSQLRVITNGIELSEPVKSDFDPHTRPYRILCTGRLSNEKSQITLLEAMRQSRYASEIEIHFAGNGPKAKKMKKAVQKLYDNGTLTHLPVFGFYSADELRQMAADSYLYIHCAIVEVEGLSCLEAIQQGTVPIIAESDLSATSQFALDKRSLFKARDPKDLAQKIDWWIEHPEERAAMGRQYSESVKKYDAADSTAKIIEMYEEAIG
ncbi:MAG: glycosyltransferase [Bacteroidales bacterium]|nr:glycosyltransferase [Bacteroidales bacterium]